MYTGSSGNATDSRARNAFRVSILFVYRAPISVATAHPASDSEFLIVRMSNLMLKIGNC
jgi:hypothetical protein